MQAFQANQFVTFSQEFKEKLKQESVRKTLSDKEMLEPKFLLFERGQKIIMAITSGRFEVDQGRLQKTGERKIFSSFLQPEKVEEIGFKPGEVHPLFCDNFNVVQRIFVDAAILVEAVIFPGMLVVIPCYDDGKNKKMLVPVHVFLDALSEFHGTEKVIFANITRKSWPDPGLLAMLKRRKVKTRFAPTPSNRLHVGNLRSALIPYLYHLKNSRSDFYLRFDDTDKNRNKISMMRKIKEELRWIGIHWKKENCFRQSKKRHTQLYRKFLYLLQESCLVERTPENEICLKNIEGKTYGNVHFDWRTGIQVDHLPPQDRNKKQKKISIVRPTLDAEKNFSPFYRYAGIIDDILLSTHVFRDIRQEHLSLVQNHIRTVLEMARKKLLHTPVLHKSFVSLHLREDQILPLPIYIHLAYMVDSNGVILNKRSGDGQFMVYRLRDDNKILPESLVTYLLSTIFPRKSGESRSSHLRAIAVVVGRYGIKRALKIFAKKIEIESSAQSIKPIVCDLKDILLADRILVQCLSKALFKRRVREYLPASRAYSKKLFSRAYFHVKKGEFSGWKEIMNLLQFPYKMVPLVQTGISKKSAFFFFNFMERDAGGNFKEDFIMMIKSLLKNSEKKKLRLLSDLRLLLMGQRSGPKVHVILDILPSLEIRHRISSCGQ